MVDVPVNSDFSTFKNVVVAGLDAQQTISGLISVGICIIQYLLLNKVIGLDSNITSLTLIPVMLLVIKLVNYNKDDFNLIEAFRYKRFKKRKGLLCYCSSENVETYLINEKEETEELSDDEFMKQVKKMIFGMVAVFVLIVIAVITLVILM